MKDRPILFSGPMVRAILEGRKTQTRRIVKPQPKHCADLPMGKDLTMASACPFGAPGDRLWVRETFARVPHPEVLEVITHYRATESSHFKHVKWRPSIHMPRWASRITLLIESVRVERLQDITEEDAGADGGFQEFLDHDENCSHDDCALSGGPKDCAGFVVTCKMQFQHLWTTVYGRESWDSNPWVWAITFRRIEA